MRRLDEHITVGAKRMRCGYTTGTCAAAAARAAAELLVRGEAVFAVTVATPAGIDVVIDIEENSVGDGWAECAVRKDAGDDPDVTDGALVRARVEWSDMAGIRIEGGQGVGRVTRAGLDQPVGEAAINPVPRKMITEQIEAVVGAFTVETRLYPSFRAKRRKHLGISSAPSWGDSSAFGLGMTESAIKARFPVPASGFKPTDDYRREAVSKRASGLLVTISVPGGEEMAARTFNPRLGIEGGISIIGTSGLVKPMSSEAQLASVLLEMRQRHAEGAERLVIVPGNYGADFVADELGLAEEPVMCSNFVGATIDEAARLGFSELLFVGHIGKMVKVAAGVMNTHSLVADARMETLAALAAVSGCSRETVANVLDAPTTDAAIDAIDGDGLLDDVMEMLAKRLDAHLSRRAGSHLRVEAIVFSKVRGALARTGGADTALRRFA